MNATHTNMIVQKNNSALRAIFLLALGCALSGLTSFAAIITNVTAVNVTPTSFSVFWRAPADTTPSLQVFADASGTTSLAGQLGIEAFPLHTGNPDLAAGYQRRLGRAALRQKTQDNSLMMIRVTGCRPDTTYYYRVTSTATAGNSENFPTSGPLPAVTTPHANTFVANYQQLIVNVTDLNPEGRVVMLTHTNAPYPLAAIVGDGVGTDQVVFDANNLFLQAGGGNFTALGSQDFAIDVLGPNQSDISQKFTLNFTASFAVAQATVASLGTEFFAATIGSTIVLYGDNGSVAIDGNTSAGLAAINLSIDIPAGHLTNLTLQGLAPELDTIASEVTSQGGSAWLIHLAAQTGQTFTGNKSLGQLAFKAGTNTSSAFVPLKITAVTATKPNASTLSQIVAKSGRAVVIGAEPLVEATRAADGSREVTLYGRPNSSYALEYASALSNASAWKLWMRVPMAALSLTLPPNQIDDPAIFYRAYEFQADPPILEGHLAADGARSLLIYGKPGKTYSIQYKTDVSPGGTWQSMSSVPLVNSFTTVPATAAGSPNVFYRAF
jgi:hypothetical protein